MNKLFILHTDNYPHDTLVSEVNEKLRLLQNDGNYIENVEYIEMRNGYHRARIFYREYKSNSEFPINVKRVGPYIEYDFDKYLNTTLKELIRVGNKLIDIKYTMNRDSINGQGKYNYFTAFIHYTKK